MPFDHLIVTSNPRAKGPILVHLYHFSKLLPRQNFTAMCSLQQLNLFHLSCFWYNAVLAFAVGCNQSRGAASGVHTSAHL
jgi:hypothetical protein